MLFSILFSFSNIVQVFFFFFCFNMFYLDVYFTWTLQKNSEKIWIYFISSWWAFTSSCSSSMEATSLIKFIIFIKCFNFYVAINYLFLLEIDTHITKYFYIDLFVFTVSNKHNWTNNLCWYYMITNFLKDVWSSWLSSWWFS